MIAEDQTLLPVQPLKNRLWLLAAEEHISHDADGIGVLNAAVPVLNDRFVHFLYRLKRAVTELQYISVPEMWVGNEIEHVSTSFFCVLEIVYLICIILANVQFVILEFFSDLVYDFIYEYKK